LCSHLLLVKMPEGYMPLKITKKALEKIRDIMHTKKIPKNYGLRVGTQSAGCIGVSHMLGFDRMKKNDMAYERNGISIFIEKKNVMYLVGLKLDYLEDEDTSGFSFLPEK